MILNGVDFGRVFWASGAENFFPPGWGYGCGWWYDKYLKILLPGLFSTDRPTFVAKTTPYYYREGNLELRDDWQPKKWFPDCVQLYFFRGIALNAVGLSSPGAKVLFEEWKWQKIKRPFFLSHMAVGNSLVERVYETRLYAGLLKKHLPRFSAPVGLEENLTCPNLGHDLKRLEDEIFFILEILAKADLGIPIFIKGNVLMSINTLLRVAQSGLCHGISISNTIPFGELSDRIPWRKFFGTDKKEKSPLSRYGGGGLSGWPLVNLVCEKIVEFRQSEPEFPILAGGGLNCRWTWSGVKRDIDKYVAAGATALSFGIGKVLRPFYLGPAIKYAEKKLKEAGR